MLSSPRKPDSTMRIFSSAENCRRVARRISLMTCSAGSFTGPDFCPIFAPSMATMGQKSSLPQLVRSVSQVLMPDSLNHSLGGLIAVYDQHDYLTERRAALDLWTNFILACERGCEWLPP